MELDENQERNETERGLVVQLCDSFEGFYWFSFMSRERSDCADKADAAAIVSEAPRLRPVPMSFKGIFKSVHE